LPPAFPVKESLLIVVGEVAEVKAYLSNDKGCVYTEFTIKPDEILKDGGSKTLDVVRADREGGIVIYPNGQRILYSSSTLGLPLLGGKYLFFLGKKGKSPNYEILTAYDVNGENASRLEYDESTGEPPRTSRFELIQDVRLRIAKIGKR